MGAIQVTITIPLWLAWLWVQPVLLYRWLRYGYAFRRIPLTQGKYAIVDPDDYARLAKHKWFTAKNARTFYAARNVRGQDGKQHYTPMHRVIINPPSSLVVDHINHNGLDNRKANLRPATVAQNTHNRRKRADRTCTSKYKGVARSRGQRLYRAEIRVDDRVIPLGYYADEAEAAKAYDRAALKYHGEFALLNFPNPKLSILRRAFSLVRTLFAILGCAPHTIAIVTDTLSLYKLKPLLRGNFSHFTTTLWPDLTVTHNYHPHPWRSRCPSLDPCLQPPVSCLPSPVSCLPSPVSCLPSPVSCLLPHPPLTLKPPGHTVAAMAKSLYIIDGHAHIYAAYYAPMRRRLTSPSGEPTKATYIFTMALLGLIQRRKPDMLAVALDSKEPTFRSEMYADYKAHRPPMPDDMPAQIDRIEQILEAMRIPALRINGVEADDIIGTLAKRAAADGYECFICSGDKDILQLLSDRISAYNMKTDAVMTLGDMIERMGVTPEQFIECLALQGDTSDNVPGIPDVGPKTALAWIQKYGSIKALYEHADEIKGKRGDNLRKHTDILELSKKLVTIDSSVPLDVSYDQLALHAYDKSRLAALFSELGFTRLLSRLDLSAAAPAEPAEPTPQLTGPASAKTVTHKYTLIDTADKFAEFLAKLRNQDIFAIDTETTSIDAMRADLVGMSFSWQPHTGYYLPLRAPLGGNCLEPETVKRRLGPVLAGERAKKVGQNIKYDMLVLENAGLPLKGIYFDTMVASYCLDPSRGHSLDAMALEFLGYECIPLSALIGKGRNQLTFDMVDIDLACEYAAEDADVTWRLYLHLKDQLDVQPDLKDLFYDVEMPLVSVLAALERNGVSLDTALLRRMSGRLTEELQHVTEQIYQHAGPPFNIDSPKQLAEVLFDRLGLESLRVGKAGRSTDAGVLEQLADQHPIAEMILRYRTLNKLKNTYVDKLGTIINPRTGRVHASFNQTVTATGRLSSSNPNLQNIPIRTELGRTIRSAFVPPAKTDCILSADYSQIELRLLASFSGDAALREAFAADQDIHRFVASQIYGVPLDEVTSEMRSRCKAVNFGIIYGQGPFGLARTTGLSQADAKQFIEDYFSRYSSIRAFLDDCVARAKQSGYAETILHRRREIANLSSRNANKRRQAERLAVNTVIQGSAADLIKVAMISIHRKIETERLTVRMILQVHDELVFELPTSEVDDHAKWIAAMMTGAIKLDVPLKVDIAHGPSWLADK